MLGEPTVFSLVLLLVGGLYLLVQGADHLVDGASAVALRLGVSPFMVGLTVVAFGTSAPELATSLSAVLLAVRGDTEAAGFAVGNVIGSNVCNLALILGVAACLVPIGVRHSAVRRELPFLVVMSFTLAGLIAWSDTLGLFAGGLLLLLFAVFFALVTREAVRDWKDARRGAASAAEVEMEAIDVDVEKLRHMRWWAAAGLVLLGLVVLRIGSGLLVDSAGQLARMLHVREELIGLTIVALGTSLPELATTVVAVRKSSPDLAMGNVIGSNVFNIGLVVGLPSLLIGWPLAGVEANGDLVAMLAFTVGVAGLALLGRRLDRRDGTVLLAGYAAYMAWLVVEAMTDA